MGSMPWVERLMASSFHSWSRPRACWLYDSVTHVPLILWAPGKVPVAQSSAMVTLVDVLPTVLEVLGLPEADGIDGRSLLPLVKGEVASHRDMVMLSEATWQAARGVRTPEWKYIKFMQSTIYGRDGVELYDLAADPHEQNNVADDHPEVVATMGAQLQHWLSAQLAGRPDPMLSVIDAGLPAVARLNDVVAEALRPPGPEEPPPVPPTGNDPASSAVTVVVEPAPPHVNGDPRVPPGHRQPGRLRGARRVVVAAVVVAAAALLGAAVNNVRLSNP